MQVRHADDNGGNSPRPHGFLQVWVARRHVDLLRVSSALCPGMSPVC